MGATNVEPKLSRAQIDHLSTLCVINNIDDHLKIVSSVDILDHKDPNRVLLALDIFYAGEKISVLSFNLHNYEYEDIVHVVQNIRNNEFILQEVDNFLAGDIE